MLAIRILSIQDEILSIQDEMEVGSYSYWNLEVKVQYTDGHVEYHSGRGIST